MKKFVLYILFSLLGMCGLFAQKLTIQAPKVVEVGEVFRVSYAINTETESNFQLSDVNGFVLVGGPQKGHSSQMSFVNGKRTQSVEISETYYFRAESPGRFRLPIAKTIVNGQTVQSTTHVVEVVGSAQAKQNIQQQNLDNEIAEDVFARINVNKNEVYVGEALYLSIKLYTRYQLNLNDHSFPNFNGFYKKDLEEIQTLTAESENINGKQYNSYAFKKLVLFPQKSGDLKIEPFETDIDVLIPAGRSFWGVQHKQERKYIKSNSSKITVKPLPSGKPASFGGAVGEFKVNAGIDATEIKQNEAFTYKITISGTGNMSLISSPKLNLTNDFEVYDPKITEKTSITVRGDKGSKTFEFLVIPRREGKFTLPAYEFSYFNPVTKSYKTITIDEIPIEVKKSEGGSSNVVSNFSNAKEEIQYFGNDIQYIKTGNLDLGKKTEHSISSGLFYLWYIIPTVFLLALAYFKRVQIKQSSDIALVKNRKANKESKKRLKTARIALENNDDAKYYEEVAKALWGYIADKYSIQTAELSTEIVLEYLQNKSVSEEYIKELSDLLQQCEMARFAPSLSVSGKEQLYSRASDIILKFEQIIK